MANKPKKTAAGRRSRPARTKARASASKLALMLAAANSAEAEAHGRAGIGPALAATLESAAQADLVRRGGEGWGLMQ